MLCYSFFIGCGESNTPKATVKNFIISLKKLDFDKASFFLTKETQPIFFTTKTELQSSWDFEKKIRISDSLSKKEIIKDYDLDHLTEIVVNKNAIVHSSDGTNEITLEKTNGDWKIICTKDFLDEILIGNNEGVELAYNELSTYFQEQVDIARTIIMTSPNTETAALKKKVAEITTLFNDDSEIEMSNISIMNSKQNDLHKLMLDFLKTKNVQSDIGSELEYCEKKIQTSKLNYNSEVSDNRYGFGQNRNFKLIPLN